MHRIGICLRICLDGPQFRYCDQAIVSAPDFTHSDLRARVPPRTGVVSTRSVLVSTLRDAKHLFFNDFRVAR
jgi:hypothetical protein